MSILSEYMFNRFNVTAIVCFC